MCLSAVLDIGYFLLNLFLNFLVETVFTAVSAGTHIVNKIMIR